MTAKTNHYCDRLDLPVPRLEEFVGKRDIKPFDLLVVALLEHGAPLSSELLITRLNEIRNERWKRLAEERQVVLAREREQARQIAAGLRRALLHVLPAKGVQQQQCCLSSARAL